MGGVEGDAGAEEDSEEGVGGAVAEDEGGFGVEVAAAGEADDVVEEALGAGEGAVLIVDFGVDVADVAALNEFGGGVVEAGGPAAEFDVEGKGGGDGDCVIFELAVEKEAGQGAEAGGRGDGGLDKGREDALVEKQELRFDAADVGGGFEELEEVAGEGLDDEVRVGFAGGCVDVSDDGFEVFVDAEGETDDASAVEGDETGEDAGVEVLQEEVGGGAVVPVEALVPEGGLSLEERAELTRGEVAEVEDLELGDRGQGRARRSDVCGGIATLASRGWGTRPF